MQLGENDACDIHLLKDLEKRPHGSEGRKLNGKNSRSRIEEKVPIDLEKALVIDVHRGIHCAKYKTTAYDSVARVESCCVLGAEWWASQTD